MFNSPFRYKRFAAGILDFGEDIVSEAGSDSGGISSHDGSKNDTDSDYNMELSDSDYRINISAIYASATMFNEYTFLERTYGLELERIYVPYTN